MWRVRSKLLPTLVGVLLVLCIIIGVRDQTNSDRADETLFVDRNSLSRGGRANSHQYLSPTGATPPLSVGSSSSSACPSKPCYNPSSSVPWAEIDQDGLCQCDCYPPGHGASAGMREGRTRCWHKLIALNAKPNQVINTNETLSSFSRCIGACLPPSEARANDNNNNKREDSAQVNIGATLGNNGSWACRGVNWIEGELCELVGKITASEYSPSTNYWDSSFAPGETS